ncbi:MAG: S8 family serine peptidase [Lachnospiraceae bacterium]|nr:S8 family serine peptidase [Lachnospiraceae bacterium]
MKHIKVALLDSGVDKSLKLKNVMYAEFGGCYGDGDDYTGHGTSMAYVISRQKDLSIYSLKVFEKEKEMLNSESVATIQKAIIWAADNNMDIICMAFGMGYSKEIECAIEYAYDKGCVLIAADGYEEHTYPAGYKYVIPVVNTNKSVRTKVLYGMDAVMSGSSVEAALETKNVADLWQMHPEYSNRFIMIYMNRKHFMDVKSEQDYIEAHWFKTNHKRLILRNEFKYVMDNYEDIKLLKWAASLPDKIYVMKRAGLHPYFHGYYKYAKGNKKCNYVAAYIYLTRCAINGSVKGVSREGLESENEMLDEMDKILLYIEENIDKPIPAGKEGKKQINILNGYENTEKNRGIIYWGLALHTLTDVYAHSTFIERKDGSYRLLGHSRLLFGIPEADATFYVPDRYQTAKTKIFKVIEHMVHGTGGDVKDFEVVYNEGYKIGNLYNNIIQIAEEEPKMSWAMFMDNIVESTIDAE